MRHWEAKSLWHHRAALLKSMGRLVTGDVKIVMRFNLDFGFYNGS